MNIRITRMYSALCIFVVLAMALTGATPQSVSASASTTSPNIVLILTDDQDLRLGSMEAMPSTRALIGDQGMTMENFMVPNPLCCPARASLLRGQHAHNTQILYNTPPSGGFQRFLDLGHEDATVATALHAAGYRTALLGKYLNGYPSPDDPTHIPPGWDEWWVPVTDSAYSSYDYTVNDNGRLVSYGSQPQDYITDVIAGQAVEFISDTVTADPPSPFFLMVSVYAPHSPFVAAPRHTSWFSDTQMARAPNLNESDMSDKPPFMQAFPLLTPEDIASFDGYHRQRMQMLAAVDELVEDVIQALDAQGLLDNTYIVFASDNGYHMGQHRFMPGKGTPYEEDTNVPLMVRGPGIPAGVVRNDVGAIIDLAPTFAEIAGATLDVPSDGRSLLSLWGTSDPVPWRTGFLIEHWQPPPVGKVDTRLALEAPDPFDLQLQELNLENPDFRGIRTPDYKFIARLNNYELYDIVNDPNEIYNQYSDATPAFKTALQNWVTAQYECAGESCQVADALPAPTWSLLYNRADIDRDGHVGALDVIHVAGCWKQIVAGECGDRNDLDYDGDIDVLDVLRVAAAFNES